MTTYGDMASDPILKAGLAHIERRHEEYEGVGLMVCVIQDGALEDEISISSEDAWLGDIEQALQDALDQDITADEDTEVWISEVYIGQDCIEATGYTDADRVLTRS